MDSADLFTVVSSLAWVFGLTLGYVLGYFAGRARTRRRAQTVKAVPAREQVTVPLPRIAAR